MQVQRIIMCFALLFLFFLFLVLQRPLFGAHVFDLAQLNIVTMIPTASFDAHQPIDPAVGMVQQGVKPVIDLLRAGNSVDATILALNSKVGKKRLIKVHSGVPRTEHSYDKKTIFIYATGWAVGLFGSKKVSDGFNHAIALDVSGGVGAFHVFGYINNGILHGPTVAFDFPTDVRTQFNIGQEADLICLKMVYDEVVRHNPAANIVFVGDCKGATAFLNLLTHPAYKGQLAQVKAIIAESPPTSLQHVAYSIAAGYVWYIPYSEVIVDGVVCLGLPAYAHKGMPSHTHATALYDDIPSNLPILIAHVEGESLVDNQHINELVATFTKTGNPHVYFYISDRWIKDKVTDEDSKMVRHGSLSRTTGFHQLVNAFLAKYDLPHDQAAAQDGVYLLERSHQ